MTAITPMFVSKTVSPQTCAMLTPPVRRLCDNPTCSAHCQVTYDQQFGWRFLNGFQVPLTKEQLMHFRPESKLNLCGRCKGGYEHMLKRARQIAARLSTKS